MYDRRIKEAVILAAGLGSRLRPLTDMAPKCLTEINGIPLITRAVAALGSAGVQSATIIIGYLGAAVQRALGDSMAGVAIRYIENPAYAGTNTARSLALAGDALRAGAYVIEGDVVFEPEILRLGDTRRPTWFTDTFPPGMTGSQFLTDEAGRIVFHNIVRDRAAPVPSSALKSCGLLRLTPEYGALLAEWLKSSRADEYYDDVIRRHLPDAPVYAALVGSYRWWEIDDADDLAEAERRFSHEGRLTASARGRG